MPICMKKLEHAVPDLNIAQRKRATLAKNRCISCMPHLKRPVEIYVILYNWIMQRINWVTDTPAVRLMGYTDGFDAY